jgi:biopolymer transport protein ExbD
MGAAIDTGGGDKKSVNVDINIVPFIDLMSCLTAFLLVTAVWINIAQINIAPKGLARDKTTKENDQPMLSVLITDEKIFIGATRVSGDAPGNYTIDRAAATAWDDYMTDMKAIKQNYFADRTDVEIAAQSRDGHAVKYQDLITAMDDAIKQGFADVGLTDPEGLSWKPQY